MHSLKLNMLVILLHGYVCGTCRAYKQKLIKDKSNMTVTMVFLFEVLKYGRSQLL